MSGRRPAHGCRSVLRPPPQKCHRPDDLNTSGGWQVQEQGAGGFWWRLSSMLCPQQAKGTGELPGVSCIRASPPTPPPITSQRPPPPTTTTLIDQVPT